MPECRTRTGIRSASSRTTSSAYSSPRGSSVEGSSDNATAAPATATPVATTRDSTSQLLISRSTASRSRVSESPRRRSRITSSSPHQAPVTMRLPTRRIITVNAARPPRLVRMIRNSATWTTNVAPSTSSAYRRRYRKYSNILPVSRHPYRDTVRCWRRPVRSNQRSMSFARTSFTTAAPPQPLSSTITQRRRIAVGGWCAKRAWNILLTLGRRVHHAAR